MLLRSIEVVQAPPPPHFVGDGFRVHNFIPGRYSMEKMSPFIMLDYNSRFYFHPATAPRGVDVHPHRGFETVTIAYKGKVAHHDNAGNSGVIGEGDVQWMTAASGILHKEYHEKQFSQEGGDFQMVQLWVNLPAKYKMIPPRYQAITHDQIHAYYLPNDQGRVEVIAGLHKGVKGVASTFTEVHLFNAILKGGAEETFTFSPQFTTSILVIEGSIEVNHSTPVPPDHFVLFKVDGDSFHICAKEDAIVLILSGEPINEPIAAHGPFVMNTRSEIMQAFDDFHAGKFGMLD